MRSPLAPLAAGLFEAIKNCIFDDAAVSKMLNDDSLEELRSDASVPHPLWVDNENRSTGADAEAWRLAALHAPWTEKEALAFEELRKSRVEVATATIRRTETADAHEHVTGISLEKGFGEIHRSASAPLGS